MKPISKIFLAAVAVAGLAGCNDEVEYSVSEQLPEGIYLEIPDPMGMLTTTKALEGGDHANTISKESLTTDLWLIACKGGKVFKSENILTALTPLEPHPGTAASKTYNLTEWFGGAAEGDSFNLYIVSNLTPYTDATAWANAIKTGADETNLTGLQLNFHNGETSYLLNHSQIKTNGLPMACLASEVDVTLDGTTSPGALTIRKGKTATIHADLKFLCSKVRYTLLFDNSSTGYSKVFEDKFPTFTVAGATGLYEGTQTVVSDQGNLGNSYSLSSVSLKTVDYPGNPDTYPTDGSNSTTDQRFTNLTANNSPGGNTRAWQGVVYVPANKDITKPTTITLTGNIAGKGEIKYTLPIKPNGTVKRLAAGKYYDVVAKITGLETVKMNSVKVEEWNRTQLLYTLMQNLYLKVDATSIEKVEAGENYTIAYESNGEVKVVGPFYKNGNDEIPLYRLIQDGDNNVVSLEVNPEIQTDWYPNIRNGKQSDGTDYDYKWIEFKVGGGIITKRVNIDDLVLNRYLTVSPKRMTIDIADLVNSGYYGDQRKNIFEVETNVNQFWIEIENWENDENAETNHIWIEEIINDDDETGTLIEFNRSGTSAIKLDKKNGVRKFRLRYEGLNSGYPIWEKNRSLKLNFKVDNTGMTGDDVVEPELYQVDIVPSVNHYTIHFASRDNFLGNPPHCYIYQCLEVPENCTLTKNGKPIASWPVAGPKPKTGNDGNTYYDDDVAALEYSFTGKIAFKGWDDPKNAAYLTDASKIDDPRYKGHFVKFEGNWNENDNPDRYNTDIDFFKQYREDASRCKCKDCRDNNYNRGWPGLIMQAENNSGSIKWSKLELTGNAVPGRALIIWSEKHEGGAQYPNEAGIRLFDYPNKEGWYYVHSKGIGGVWCNSKEESEKYADCGTYEWPAGNYRLYWSGSSSLTNENLWVWTMKHDENMQEGDDFNGGGWPGHGNVNKDGDMYYKSFTISSDKKPEDIHFKYNPGGNEGTEKVLLKTTVSVTTVGNPSTSNGYYKIVLTDK